MHAENHQHRKSFQQIVYRPVASVLLALIAIGNIAIADSPKAKRQITFEPDPEIQRLISGFADPIKGGKEDAEVFFTNLERLQKIDGKTYKKVVPNLIYYESRAKNMDDWMAVVGIIHQLRISESQILFMSLPYVGVEDELFRKELEKLIVDLEPGFRERVGFEYIDFAGYAYQKQWPPLNAVEFLYRKRPGAMVLTMAKAYYTGLETPKRRPIEWGEYSVRHVLKLKQFDRRDLVPAARREAVKALEGLSKHEEWWVRLYVAETLDQHPVFQTEEMLNRLKTDKDELVQKAISGKSLIKSK